MSKPNQYASPAPFLEASSGYVLPPNVHNELAQLLDALQSSDNSVRSQAEEHLANNWTTTKPELLLMGLVEQIQGSNDPTVQLLAR
jgi:hypothetical protein